MLRQEHGNPLCAKNDVLRIYRLEIPCCQRKTLQNKLQTILYLVCDTCPAKYKSIGIQYCMLHGFCGGNSIYSTHRSDLLRSAHIRQIRSDHQIRADQIRSSDNLTSDRSDQIIRSDSHFMISIFRGTISSIHPTDRLNQLTSDRSYQLPSDISDQTSSHRTYQLRSAHIGHIRSDNQIISHRTDQIRSSDHIPIHFSGQIDL